MGVKFQLGLDVLDPFGIFSRGGSGGYCFIVDADRARGAEMWDSGRDGGNDGHGNVVYSPLEIAADLGDGEEVAGEVVSEAAPAEVREGEDVGVELGTLKGDGGEVWGSFRGRLRG